MYCPCPARGGKMTRKRVIISSKSYGKFGEEGGRWSEDCKLS